MSDLQRKIISEIHRREEQIHFNLKDRKFKDKVGYLKGGLFELQDLRDCLANVDDTSDETALNIDLVSQQSELLNALSDSIYKEFQTYAYLPDLIEHIKSFNCG